MVMEEMHEEKKSKPLGVVEPTKDAWRRPDDEKEPLARPRYRK